MSSIRSFVQRMSPTSYIVSIEAKNSKKQVQNPKVQEIDLKIANLVQAHKQIFKDFVDTNKIIKRQMSEIKQLDKEINKHKKITDLFSSKINHNIIPNKKDLVEAEKSNHRLSYLEGKKKLLTVESDQVRQIKLKLGEKFEQSAHQLIELHNEVKNKVEKKEIPSNELQNLSTLKETAQEVKQNFKTLRKLNVDPAVEAKQLSEVKTLGKLVDNLQGVPIEVAGTIIGKKTLTEGTQKELSAIVGRLSILAEISGSDVVERKVSNIIKIINSELKKSTLNASNVLQDQETFQKISRGSLPPAEKKKALELLIGRLKIESNLLKGLKKKLDANELPPQVEMKVSIKAYKNMVNSSLSDNNDLRREIARVYKSLA